MRQWAYMGGYTLMQMGGYTLMEFKTFFERVVSMTNDHSLQRATSAPVSLAWECSDT